MKENKKEREKARWKEGSELNIYSTDAWGVVDFNAVTAQDVRGTEMGIKRTSVGFVMQVNSFQMLSKGTVWMAVQSVIVWRLWQQQQQPISSQQVPAEWWEIMKRKAFFIYRRKEKSYVVRSGERGGQVIGPP